MDDIKHNSKTSKVKVEPLAMTVSEMEAEIIKINEIHANNIAFITASHDKTKRELQTSEQKIVTLREEVASAIDVAETALGLCKKINDELKDCQECCEY